MELVEAPRIIVDAQERVLALNEAARRRFGAVEGRDVADVLHEDLDWVGDATISVADRASQSTVEVYRAAGPEVPLRQAVPDRLRSTFLANMSHELRTPLTSVLGFAKLLRSGRAGPLNDQQTHYLDRVLEGGEHLLHLVCDLLDLARIESGRLEFRPEEVDVSALVQETVAAVRPLADAKSLQIACAEAGAESGYLDPVRFKQVLYNYLSNAIKFTPEGGRVEVRLQERPGGMLRMEVEDTGIGIAEDQMPRLFTEFTQIQNDLDVQPGAGLGLAITKRIIESMGGRVGVRSQEGRGSTFWAEFPRTAS